VVSNQFPPLATPAEVAEYLRATTAALAQDRYKGTGPKFIKRASRVLYRCRMYWSGLIATQFSAPTGDEPNHRRGQGPVRRVRTRTAHDRYHGSGPPNAQIGSSASTRSIRSEVPERPAQQIIGPRAHPARVPAPGRAGRRPRPRRRPRAAR